ncbi:MAG: YraN family protein [Cyanobacteria bacterium J06633_2]
MSVTLVSISRDLQIQPDHSIIVKHPDNVGLAGEAIAAQWILSHGWQVLHHRWRCRWGELDLVAQAPFESAAIAPTSSPNTAESYPHHSENSPTLVFVEVKTRTSKNWDANGLLSITPEKKRKLWQTAELFLASYPNYSLCPCRFDLILIQHRRSPKQRNRHTSNLPCNHQEDLSWQLSTLRPSQLHDDPHSPWVLLGENVFRVERHMTNAFEQS